MEKNDQSSMAEEKGTKSYLQFQIERLKVLQAKLSTEAEEDYVIIKEEWVLIIRFFGSIDSVMMADKEDMEDKYDVLHLYKMALHKWGSTKKKQFL